MTTLTTTERTAAAHIDRHSVIFSRYAAKEVGVKMTMEHRQRRPRRRQQQRRRRMDAGAKDAGERDLMRVLFRRRLFARASPRRRSTGR